MKKRVWGMLLILVLAVSALGGCKSMDESAGSSSSSESGSDKAEQKEKKNAEDLHIVYVTPLLASDVWLVSKEGFDAAAKETGWDLQTLMWIP